MKRLFLFLYCTLATALFAAIFDNIILDSYTTTWTDPETNIIWTYTSSNDTGAASIGGTSLLIKYLTTGEYKDLVTAVPQDYSGTLTIPDTIDGKPVIALNGGAFFRCSSLTSVIIPEGVTSIGSSAFSACTSLTSVDIPSSVTSIGSSAFSGCTSLTSVIIPEGVTSIGSSAFSGCTSLTSVIIPEGVTSIGSSAFSGCTSLTSVNIPASVTSIGQDAFKGVTLEKLVAPFVPSGILKERLTSVIIPEGVTSIGRSAFSDCTSLTSVDIPSSVTSIEDSAFSGCTSLSSLDIPASVTSIGDSAFSGCSFLTSVVIPEGVTTIGDSAFSGCTSLTSVVIPASATTIGESTFYGCTSLTAIVIPEGVTSIHDNAFRECTSLTSVVIPASVTYLGWYAFEGVPLERLVTPIAPHSIRERLTSVVIPEGVTTIGEAAFSGCTSLTSIVIPESVTTIEDSAFYGCSSLTSIVIPEGVSSIGNNVFSDCANLRTVKLPASIQTIGDAFRNTLCKIIISGRPPRGFGSLLYTSWINGIEYPEEYTMLVNRELFWERLVSGGPYTRVNVTSEMTTPKTMKVTYKVDSGVPLVKVRAVAWKDGVRSFANIVPVKTAAEGSPEVVPNGEAVTTGVEHTFIWQVSDDWSIDLAKVAVEVLAEDAGLLPQDLVTIPATETHAKMTFTVNTPTTAQLFNALVWYYADGDSALTVSNGVVRVNGTQVASGSSLTAWGCINTTLLNYLYGKLGYKVLSGSDLSYAQAMTRLPLPNSGLDQLSVKISEE